VSQSLPGGSAREVAYFDDYQGSRVTLASLLAFLVKYFRLLVLLPFVAAVLGLAVAVVSGRTYTAYSSILPEHVEGSGYGGVSALASQFGIALPGGAAGNSIDFYSAFIREYSTLRRLANTEYRFAHEGDTLSGKWLDLAKVEAPTEHLRQIAGVRLLATRIETKPVLESGVLEIRTESAYPQLAEQINRRILELIEEFNLERRRRYAVAEREFLGGRAQEALGQLRSAEADFERFLERNRTYQASPELTVAAARLQRAVELRQQLYISLAQAYEQARVEEVRQTPQVTVLTEPEGTVDRSRLLPTILLFGFLGGVFGLSVALAMEWIDRQRTLGSTDFAYLSRWRPWSKG
jgi:uncharacterized protein involved in exopolysaccharide biosynthesis